MNLERTLLCKYILKVNRPGCWSCDITMKEKTPLSREVVCFQMLDFATSSSKSEVSKSSFSKTTSWIVSTAFNSGVIYCQCVVVLWVGLGWVGLGWVGLGWIGLDWIDWIGLNWIELNWIELNWMELNWIELKWFIDKNFITPRGRCSFNNLFMYVWFAVTPCVYLYLPGRVVLRELSCFILSSEMNFPAF